VLFFLLPLSPLLPSLSSLSIPPGPGSMVQEAS
jgi:hypothetical protein